MDVYIARQPIFNTKMNVFGYELLYRRGMNNFYEGLDDSKSTAELINNAYLSMQFNELTSGTRAFINFSEEMLIKKIPLLLPKESIVVEILERVKITEGVIDACKELRAKGYMIALDDFVFNESYLPLIELANIIKIEFPVMSHDNQKELINRYKNKIKFLAEKVETREDYELASKMGYDYFQGYFFSKPVIVQGKEIGSLNSNFIRIINELNQKEPEYQRIAEIIETDIDLTYKMLKVANSVFYEAKNEIRSIKLALVRFGFSQIKEWIYLMMVKEIQCVENEELIKNCLVRAKLMELLAGETGDNSKLIEYFLTGMFSSIDVLLNRNMKDVIKELPFSDDVIDALLGRNNDIKNTLDFVINLERANWDDIDMKVILPNLTQERFIAIYIEALKWARTIK
nr:HDOD domain-containing protein [Sedimentibacter sp.]